MAEFWAVFWMVIVLKIPIVMLLGLVWYAISQPPVSDEDASDGRGGSDRDPHVGPRVPTPPRRGPHRTPVPCPPQRNRARGRRLERTH